MIGLEIIYSLYGSQLTCKDDALITVIHCFLVNNGFRAVGIGSQESGYEQPSERLPNGWNLENGSYVLRYRHSDGHKNLLLKAFRIDQNLMVNILQTPGDLTSTIDIPTDNYFTNNFTSYNGAFLNGDSLSSLEQTLTKMMNDLKPQQPPQQPPQRSNPVANRPPRIDPLMEPGRGYYQPEPNYGPRPSYFPSVGKSDLDPFQRGGGGMILDPRGFPNFHRPPRDPRGPYGLPPGAIPPGARFDPFGPPEPRRPGPRDPRPRGGGGFGGPDPDHMQPPGYDDMFM